MFYVNSNGDYEYSEGYNGVEETALLHAFSISFTKEANNMCWAMNKAYVYEKRGKIDKAIQEYENALKYAKPIRKYIEGTPDDGIADFCALFVPFLNICVLYSGLTTSMVFAFNKKLKPIDTLEDYKKFTRENLLYSHDLYIKKTKEKIEYLKTRR